MWEAAFWGLVQGLTEFLPVSSSGHLVIVPAALEMEDPDLAITAVLHLGTLLAVVAYYRADLARLARFRHDPTARRIIWLLALGTVPAAVLGIAFESTLDDLFDSPTAVGWALIGTGLILLASARFRSRQRRLDAATPRDALVVGAAQAAALVPGISRSGATITAGLAAGFDRVEAARFSFLLSIPAITGGGLLQAIDLAGQGGLRLEVFVGAAVAAVSGYLAIAVLIRLLTRVGLVPFTAYCFLVGIASVLFI